MNSRQLTPAPVTTVTMNRAQRRRAAKRKRKAQITGAAICAAVTLTAGVMFGGFSKPKTADTQIIFTATPPAQTYTVDTLEYQPPQTTEETQPTQKALLASVPLDIETQQMIYEMCGERPDLFCTVMAIAKRESRFDPEAVGDGGNSIGMMQINTYWQRDRIERLGVTDLTDIEQNMAVAIDFLWWIADRLAPEHPDSVFGDGAVFMVYNCGLQGASNLWEQGIKDTAYSRECLASYQAFMAEMEVRV